MKDSSLLRVTTELEQILDKLNISERQKILEDTYNIYLKYSKPGIQRELVLRAALYIALRKNDIIIPVGSYLRIANKQNIPLNVLKKMIYSLIESEGVKRSPTQLTVDYIKYAGKQLNLPDDIIQNAISLYEQHKDGYFKGKKPNTVAAACIYYFIKGKDITQDDLSVVLDASTTAIRYLFRWLEKHGQVVHNE